MSETQTYKTVKLSPQELANVLVALEDREDDLIKQIAEAEAVAWNKTAEDLCSDLDAVRKLIADLSK